MQFKLNKPVKKILILGAGASVDYGLPVWKDLGSLIRRKIYNDTKDNYKFKNQILEWVQKVDEKKYDSIDKCILQESILFKDEGPQIENELFSIIKDIFDRSYKDNENGWIRILNEKILNDKTSKLEHSLSFVNFNYDEVLERNLLDFSYLPSKLKAFKRRTRLSELVEIKLETLYPHGKFSEIFSEESHVIIKKQTIKSYDPTYLDVISCYDNEEEYTIYNPWDTPPFELYIMGLGGGLKINLDKLKFPYNSIDKVFITIKNPAIKDDVIKFLNETYETSEIQVYSTCEELVTKCF
jgi:hypothetical protein